MNQTMMKLDGGLFIMQKAKKIKSKEDKFEFVMHEFGAGRLKSSDGKIVTNIKQAQAIAHSESEKYMKEDEELDDMKKGKNTPIGAIATWADGKQYRKVSAGTWELNNKHGEGHKDHAGGGDSKSYDVSTPSKLHEQFRVKLESMNDEHRAVFRGGKMDFEKKQFIAPSKRLALQFADGKVSIIKLKTMEKTEELDEPMEKARTHKYIKRIPNTKKGKGWIYFYNREQWSQYKKDGTIPKQEETGSVIWSGIMNFFGFKDEAKAESKVKADYETHKDAIKGVSYESFIDHVSEYFNNKEKWDARISAKPKEKGEKKESKPKTETTAKKESSGGGKKFNLSVMKVIAGIYGGKKEEKSGIMSRSQLKEHAEKIKEEPKKEEEKTERSRTMTANNLMDLYADLEQKHSKFDGVKGSRDVKAITAGVITELDKKGVKELSSKVFDKLEDENYHNLNTMLSLSGYFGKDMQADTIKRNEKYIAKGKDYEHAVFPMDAIPTDKLPPQERKEKQSEPEDSTPLSTASDKLKEELKGEKPVSQNGSSGYSDILSKIKVKSPNSIVKDSLADINKEKYVASNDLKKLGVWTNAMIMITDKDYASKLHKISEKGNYPNADLIKNGQEITERIMNLAKREAQESPATIKGLFEGSTGNKSVVIQNADGNDINLNTDLLNVFSSHYGDTMTLHPQKEADQPVLVKSKGEIVGVIMPVMTKADVKGKFIDKENVGGEQHSIEITAKEMYDKYGAKNAVAAAKFVNPNLTDEDFESFNELKEKNGDINKLSDEQKKGAKKVVFSLKEVQDLKSPLTESFKKDTSYDKLRKEMGADYNKAISSFIENSEYKKAFLSEDAVKKGWFTDSRFLVTDKKFSDDLFKEVQIKLAKRGKYNGLMKDYEAPNAANIIPSNDRIDKEPITLFGKSTIIGHNVIVANTDKGQMAIDAGQYDLFKKRYGSSVNFHSTGIMSPLVAKVDDKIVGLLMPMKLKEDSEITPLKKDKPLNKAMQSLGNGRYIMLEKGKAATEGEVRTYKNGKKYKKMGPGKWVEVKDGKTDKPTGKTDGEKKEKPEEKKEKGPESEKKRHLKETIKKVADIIANAFSKRETVPVAGEAVKEGSAMLNKEKKPVEKKKPELKK